MSDKLLATAAFIEAFDVWLKQHFEEEERKEWLDSTQFFNMIEKRRSLLILEAHEENAERDRNR